MTFSNLITSGVVRDLLEIAAFAACQSMICYLILRYIERQIAVALSRPGARA